MIHLQADSPILFFDLQEIEQRQGIKQCLEKATKFDGNPVVRVGKVDAPDALQLVWPFAALYDPADRLFKMWYSATGHMRTTPWNTAYAYSEDGIDWIKPNLGLHEYCGSKNNNLVWLAGTASVPHALFIDPEEKDPNKRFKALISEIAGGGALINGATVGKAIITSPDGIHWSREEGPYILEDVWPPGIGSRPAKAKSMHWIDIHQLMYDPYDPNPQHRYKIYGQSGSRQSPTSRTYRSISLATSATFGERLVCYEGNPILDIEREEEIHFSIVHRIGGYYVMLHEFAFFEPIDDRYTGDVRLSFSRDGFEFERIMPREAIVERGKVSEWDSCSIVTGSELIEKNDKIWFYYSGASEKWNNWPQRGPKGFPVSTGAVQAAEIGLAWLRADGFTYLICDDAILPGSFTTQALVIPDQDGLQLAVGTDKTQIRRSWLEVEVLDAHTNEPIAGFSKDECIRCVKDGIRVPVRWKENGNLDKLAGKSVKLRFFLYGAVKLYSFRVL